MEWYWIVLILFIAYIVWNNTLVLKNFINKHNLYIDFNKESHENMINRILNLENEIVRLKKDNNILKDIIKNEKIRQEREYSLKYDVEHNI